MIADSARIAAAVPDRPRAPFPWLLAVAGALLVILALYLLFGAYLPAKKRIVRLEAELRDVYAREAALQTRLARDAERAGAREHQLSTLAGERDGLRLRVDELERELAASRRPRRAR